MTPVVPLNAIPSSEPPLGLEAPGDILDTYTVFRQGDRLFTVSALGAEFTP
jgi:hypothetical protein